MPRSRVATRAASAATRTVVPVIVPVLVAAVLAGVLVAGLAGVALLGGLGAGDPAAALLAEGGNRGW